MTRATTQKLPAGCCELGEGPHYDAGTDTAWWFDIVGGTLLEHRFGSAETIEHRLPRMASVVARIDDERQLLAMEDGLYLRTRSNGGLALLSPLEADNPATRSNDGRVHPSGNLWIGTMGRNAEWQAGAIYLFDGTTVTPLFRKVTIPNSICFSPDGRTAYFADTAVNTVWRVGVDVETGRPVGEPEVFLTEKDLPLGGHFDGSVTDADGNLWNAAWGSGTVSGYAPDGRPIRTFEIHAAQTSCPAFVGPRLDRLLVTTAWQGYDDAARACDPGAGFTYVIDGDFKGRADPDFRLSPETAQTT
ncbi:SMP-30/gluconolactonase/LRE family protein [Oricola sp.]|uniref:SMP-30/gluconolactonase/LRE family protein n=1 Tax=Oricola sp. TaxID=1979950 RepID=UPI0025EE9FB4|nr:SMP-30/gluconolactonase/LRE family protein [Oricola sp.]MCI5078357.1 SMP-30/gluconolactonase/LRE family protein [Oricola sp.]